MSHTPGPWRYEERTDKRDERVIRSADGKAIFCDTSYYPWCSDNEADWPLIAAAPDLYEACKGLLQFVRERYPNDFVAGGRGFICPHHLAIEAAIAKAEAK